MEYTEDQMTEWFDINECKPLEKGAYVVKDNYGFIMASIWNGEYFQSCSGLIDDGVLTVKEAVEQISHQTFSHDETMFPITHWRGLNLNPNAPKKPEKKANKRKTQYGVLRLMPNGQINFEGSFGKKSDALVFAKKLKNKYGASHELHVCKKRLRVEA